MATLRKHPERRVQWVEYGQYNWYSEGAIQGEEIAIFSCYLCKQKVTCSDT